MRGRPLIAVVVVMAAILAELMGGSVAEAGITNWSTSMQSNLARMSYQWAAPNPTGAMYAQYTDTVDPRRMYLVRLPARARDDTTGMVYMNPRSITDDTVTLMYSSTGLTFTDDSTGYLSNSVYKSKLIYLDTSGATNVSLESTLTTSTLTPPATVTYPTPTAGAGATAFRLNFTYRISAINDDTNPTLITFRGTGACASDDSVVLRLTRGVGSAFTPFNTTIPYANPGGLSDDSLTNISGGTFTAGCRYDMTFKYTSALRLPSATTSYYGIAVPRNVGACESFNQTSPGVYLCTVGAGITRLRLDGASGAGGDATGYGGTPDKTGGAGVAASGGLLSVTPGQVIKISIGEDGADWGDGSARGAGGGGGYTAIATTDDTPIVVLGGGGGASQLGAGGNGGIASISGRGGGKGGDDTTSLAGLNAGLDDSTAGLGGAVTMTMPTPVPTFVTTSGGGGNGTLTGKFASNGINRAYSAGGGAGYGGVPGRISDDTAAVNPYQRAAGGFMGGGAASYAGGGGAGYGGGGGGGYDDTTTLSAAKASGGGGGSSLIRTSSVLTVPTLTNRAPATSPFVTLVDARPDVTSATVTGTAQVRQVLTAQTTYTSAFTATKAVQWQASPDGTAWSNISGATDDTFTVRDSDYTSYVRYVVTVTASGGDDSAVSSSTGAIAGIAPDATSASISGTPQVRQTLSASSTINPGYPAATATYRWQTSPDGTAWSSIGGATDDTYAVPDSAYGTYLRVIATATNPIGDDSVASSPTTQVLGLNPTPGTVTITGTTGIDDTLVATLVGGGGIPAPTITWTWQALDDSMNWIDIPAATDETFTITTAQYNRQLRAVATADNGGGPVTTDSSPTAPISGIAPELGAVTVAGTPEAGQTLQAAAALNRGYPAPTTTYAWQSSPDNQTWTAIANATGDTYQPTGQQVGLLIRAEATAANGIAPDDNAVSSAVGPVTAAPSPPAPNPVVPAGPPRDVTGEPGNAQATLRWSPPASSGSAPITAYQAVSSPGGQACITTGELACTVTGLRNGTTYRFTVSALTGAGWGAPSKPSAAITPTAPPTPTILITGQRTGTSRVTANGIATGLDGVPLEPWSKTSDQKAFQLGNARPVPVDGQFTWSRNCNKSVKIYFTANGIRSNKITIPAP